MNKKDEKIKELEKKVRDLEFVIMDMAASVKVCIQSGQGAMEIYEGFRKVREQSND